MRSVVVTLECITNMHVGNGDVNYNIIDNEVEKDPITGYPTINSSGVKGALREYFTADKELKAHVNEIFGSDKQGESTSGKLKFLAADLIARPARASLGNKAYYLVSTDTALERFEELKALFSPDTVENQQAKDVIKEDVIAVEGIALKERRVVLGKEIYVMKKDDFDKITLPVMARNKLNNGISENLWYEEVVPYKSMFCFPVMCNEKDHGMLKEFITGVNGKVIQFGGNASIGYGLCKVTVMGEQNYE